MRRPLQWLLAGVALALAGGVLAIDSSGYPSRPTFQSLLLNGNAGISTCTGGVAVICSITSNARSAWNLEVHNASAAGNALGLDVTAGQNSGDIAFQVRDTTGSNVFFRVDGAGDITTPNATTVPWVQQSGSTIGTKSCGVRNATQTVTSTTLTADTQLQVTVPAAGTYLLDLFVEFQGVTTGTQGYKFNFGGTSPGGAENGGYGENGFINGAAQAAGEVSALSTVTAFGTVDTGLPNDWVKINGVYNSLRTGTLVYQFAENSASANGVANINGSYLCITRIQ